MRILKAQRGLSLVEVTIMLLVLMLLTGVLAPSIFDFVNDAKWVKVKEDCEAIGLSIARLARDVGPCLKKTPFAGCTENNRADLLTSDGPAPTIHPDITGDYFGNSNLDGNIMWTNSESTLEEQLVTNTNATWGVQIYPSAAGFGPTNPHGVGPHFNLGWRGAYLSAPIGPDPWGHRYVVTSAFLSVAYDESTGGRDFAADGGFMWNRDAVCLSAGPDGHVSSPIGGSTGGGLDRKADDIVYVI
jgi:type II secretory pathway pseudopilin PulG